ncbi:MAG: type II toxin-antitoxin system HigB family toxin [Caldilineaceae bacterium]|nr:type II toxin-antitoxin system HigB family toxin [Caldilineaceae bacterium]
MHIISLKTLRSFWELHPDAEQPLSAWHAIARRAQWRTPVDIRAVYGSASFVGNNRVVFNIKGNDYRLIVLAEYGKGKLFIRFVGTHTEYDQIDARTI